MKTWTAYVSERLLRAVCDLIGFYRAILSPIATAILGPACRYQPTCSAYAEVAVARFGLARGGWLALKRLLRCRPGGGWGYDPVAGAESGHGQ